MLKEEKQMPEKGMLENRMLEIKDLEIEFHDHSSPEKVVHHFNLSMEEGQIVGIVGESGSGKTMSALALCGLLARHDMNKRGEILFDGLELLSCSRQKMRQLQGNEISIIFQEPMTSLNPVKKIGWQVEEALRLHTDLSKEECYERAIWALKEAELPEPEKVYEQYPHELSGGMRQRVMIAAAIVCNPRILVADEPTTALDVTIQEQIIRLLLKLNREHKTAILFISHDLSLVRKLCHRVVVMQNGYIVEQGDTEDIFRHPQQEYTKRLIAAIPGCEEEKEEKDFSGSEVLLEAEDIRVSYYPTSGIFGKRQEKQVLKGVELTLHKGEVLGLVGESGCGKSTLARVLVGLHKSYGGRLQTAAGGVRMVFQDPYSSLNPSKTIGWILEEPLRVKGGFTKAQRKQRVAEMLTRVGLEEAMAERYPRQLSGGQRQRVCIGLALMSEPEVLIADEPVSALDVTIQAQILKLLQQLKEEMGLAILFISHDLRVVYQICDNVMIMQNGEIVEKGTPQKLYSGYSHPYTGQLLEAAGLGR